MLLCFYVSCFIIVCYVLLCYILLCCVMFYYYVSYAIIIFCCYSCYVVMFHCIMFHCVMVCFFRLSYYEKGKKNKNIYIKKTYLTIFKLGSTTRTSTFIGDCTMYVSDMFPKATCKRICTVATRKIVE